MKKREETITVSVEKPFPLKKWVIILGMTFLGYLIFHQIVDDVIQSEAFRFIESDDE